MRYLVRDRLTQSLGISAGSESVRIVVRCLFPLGRVSWIETMPVGVLVMALRRFRGKWKYGRVVFLGSKIMAREREGRACIYGQHRM